MVADANWISSCSGTDSLTNVIPIGPKQWVRSSNNCKHPGKSISDCGIPSIRVNRSSKQYTESVDCSAIRTP